MRCVSKLAITNLIVISLLTFNLPIAKATFFWSDVDISNRVISAEKGAEVSGKIPYTITVQTKVRNKNLSNSISYASLETVAWLLPGISSNGNFKTPAQGETVTASVTPTVSTVTGTDNSAASTTTSRYFNFTANAIRTIPANSYVQLEFSFTVEFPTAVAAEVVRISSNIGDGAGGYGDGGSPDNVQDADLASLTSLSINVTTGGGVTASFGTFGRPGYFCDSNETGSTVSCFIHNTYYGKPYVTFTATAITAGFEFVGWGGDCSVAGTSPTCTLRVTGGPSITANFLPYPTITSALPSSEYFANNITISGTRLNSADGWAIYYAGAAGVTDDLIYESTSFVSKSATSATVQLPTRVQIGTYSTTYFGGSARTASSGLTWIIYPYADRTTYKTYGGTAANLTINSIGVPDAPTIGLATSTSASSATVTFSAPASNGGATITGYSATSSPGGFTGTLAGATAGTITVTGLSASTAYTFTVTATNSEGTSGASSASISITTSASSGGTGGGGTTTSTTAADELRRQQEAATAAKQKQDQELREILSLVPTIAGLAQGIAGLGNSLLLPKKCVKGKLVKNVKAGAKCPKGYKAKK
jgi:hypothetical protein